MSIGLYLVVIGAMSFIGGMSQVIPEIFILIGLFMMFTGITIASMSEVRIKERIDRLENKIKEMEEKKK